MNRESTLERIVATVDPRLAAAAWAIVLIVALLAPFDGYTPNGAVWTAGGGLAFPDDGVARTTAPPVRLHARLVETGALTVEAWVESAGLEQFGPARLVSYSLNTSFRNFTLGQEGGDLVVRLRTTETDLNGQDDPLIVEDVFRASGGRHIVFTYDGTEERAYVDGELWKSRRKPGSLANWNPSHLLVFGNETSGDRPWRGRLRLVALYDRALDPREVAASYRAPSEPDRVGVTHGLVGLYRFTPQPGRIADESGLSPALDLEIPAFVQPFRPFFQRDRHYLHGRLVEREAREIAVNLLIFVPLGFLVGLALRSAGATPLRAAAATLAAGFLLSLALESLQYLIVSRYSELGDVILNTLGTLIGFALASVASRGRPLPVRS